MSKPSEVKVIWCKSFFSFDNRLDENISWCVWSWDFENKNHKKTKTDMWRRIEFGFPDATKQFP